MIPAHTNKIQPHFTTQQPKKKKIKEEGKKEKQTFLGESPKNKIIIATISKLAVTIVRFIYEKVKKEKEVQVKSTMFVEKAASRA